MAHYEAQTHYRSEVPERLAWHAVTLALKYRLAVETTLILLDQRFPGLEVPASVEALNDPDGLESLVKDLLAAPDAGSARSILQRD